jgi:hypothetical protein
VLLASRQGQQSRVLVHIACININGEHQTMSGRVDKQTLNAH